MNILALDTSNQTLAVAITKDQQLLGQIQTTVKRTHSLSLMPTIDYLFKSVLLTPKEIDRVVVAQGPGSYTGLRIGVTTAKTLAYTLQKELVGISGLKALAANCVGISGWIIPLFDARRNNVYAGVYQWQAGELTQILPDQHIAMADLIEKVAGHPVYFVGLDTPKFAEEINAALPKAVINSVTLWDIPNAAVLAELGEKAEPETDIQGFLPHYLKRVEAEEKWLETHQPENENYVEKI